ncbi:CsbD family protein [Sphingomonas sp. ASV193]|uniref:CsbD family protein n=1 Tax=Sphingomonas sp. ASV193 TaxID=3144405 RepID=UPI0032E9376E
MGEFTDKLKGHVNDAIGELKQKSDNPDTQAEGKRQEIHGEMQKTKGEVEGAMGDRI